MSKQIYLISFCLFTLLACQQPQTELANSKSFPIPNNTLTKPNSSTVIPLDSANYHDKVLGLLVGSAIGDAMGAPVEMWDKRDIQNRYGFIDRLIPNARVASAEGTWKSNMIAGTSTDDTRWKWLMGEFFTSLESENSRVDTIDAFAKYIVAEYDQLKEKITKEDGLNPNDLESNVRYLQWLQEWVKVSEAWLSKDLKAYTNASNKFYGGEMACGGMLYAPMLGVLYPEQAADAYQLGWDMSIFDIGYAKDITAMTAAITAMAFSENLTTDSLLSIHYSIDNQQLADSRLIGRIVNSIYEGALADRNSGLRILAEKDDQWYTNQLKNIPPYFKNNPTKYYLMRHMFDRMDNKLQDIAFHANEIYMITLSTLLFAEGNFMDAMVFVTNYGRDNDTAGAVVGAILGAQLGFKKLPKAMREKVLAANISELNLDLEELAAMLVKDKSYQKNLSS